MADSRLSFVAMDRLLDACRSSGPQHLKIAEIADVVVNAMLHQADEVQCYDLHAFVVMANHVHMLITPTTRRRANHEVIERFYCSPSERYSRLVWPFLAT